MKYTLGKHVTRCARCNVTLGYGDEYTQEYNKAQGMCDSCTILVHAAIGKYDKALSEISAPFDAEGAELTLFLALYPNSDKSREEAARLRRAKELNK